MKSIDYLGRNWNLYNTETFINEHGNPSNYLRVLLASLSSFPSRGLIYKSLDLFLGTVFDVF